MECGMVGWSVACLVGWLAGLLAWAVEAECGEHRRCVPALACVTYKQETACWGDTLLTNASHTAHTQAHMCRYAYASNLRVPECVLYERSIFWETFWRICGWTPPACFPVAPMVEFSLQWRGYCNASFFRWDVRGMPVSHFEYLARSFGASWSAACPQPVALCDTCFRVIVG